jgi:hypothetical protein
VPLPVSEPVSWEPSENDRLAEVEHVDGQRRPWRAVALALVVLAMGSLVLPRPLALPSVAAVAVLAALAAVAGWQFPVVRMRRTERSGTTAVLIEAEPLRVTISRAGLERRLAPDAVERLVVGSDHVFLHLGQAEVLTIPCRVFGARGSLDRFVERIERFRRRGVGPASLDPPDGPEAGRAYWSLEYELDSAGSLVTGSARDGDLHRALVLGLVLASVLALGVSATSWRASTLLGQEALLVVLFVGVGGLFVAAAGRPRVPRGEVRLSIGPEGGWMATHEGSARFEWTRVLGVEVSPGLVVLRFADRVVPVPSVAFMDDEERRRFARQARRWWRDARRARIVRKIHKRGGPADRNPFAPPWNDR